MAQCIICQCYLLLNCVWKAVLSEIKEVPIWESTHLWHKFLLCSNVNLASLLLGQRVAVAVCLWRSATIISLIFSLTARLLLGVNSFTCVNGQVVKSLFYSSKSKVFQSFTVLKTHVLLPTLCERKVLLACHHSSGYENNSPFVTQASRRAQLRELPQQLSGALKG